MPTPKLIDELELHGLKFRLHRIRGFEAFKAKAAWAGVVGEQGAHLLALSADKVMEIAEEIMTDRQKERFKNLGSEHYQRALALLAIVQCMRRDRMTPEDMAALVEAFILGHVEIVTKDGPIMIHSTLDLDEQLDGSHDGDIWNDLLWRQIPHCLGPTIAIDAT